MEFIIPAVSLIVSGLGMVCFAATRRWFTGQTKIPVTPQWIDEISQDRYRPMLRLLDGDDLEFLQSQPGFTRKMARKVRIQRSQIFRGYLRALHRDFQRVSAALKMLLVHASNDRPDLASALLRSQLRFAMGLVAVECRLFLYRWGVSGVDVSELVQVFDSMRLELRSLTPASVGSLC